MARVVSLVRIAIRWAWRPIPVLAIATNVGAQQAHASDDAVRMLPSMTVIAMRPAPVAGSFFSLSRADFAPLEPFSGVQVLRQIPGVTIDRSGASGSVSSLYLRGGDPNWTAIFIDGVRINDPTNSRGGSVDLSFLDPGMIERIDVIRGPASALLGSDAISGAIDIVTHSPATAPSGSVDTEAGTRGHERVDTRATGALGDAGASVYAGASESGSQVPGGATRLRTLASRLRSSADWPGTLDIALHAFDATAHAFPDDSGGPRYAVIRDVDRRHAEQQEGSLSYRMPTLDSRNVSLLATFLHRSENDVSPGVAPGVRDPVGIPPNRANSRYERQTLRFTSEAPSIGGLRIAAGAEYAHEWGESVGSLDLASFRLPSNFALSRATVAAFAEAQLTLGKTSVGGSVRIDRPDHGPTVTSPRIGLVYSVDDATDVRTSYGKGFKLPSFFALSNPIVGNPDLVPERSQATDVAITQRLGDGRAEISLALYRSRVEHAIDFDEGPPPRLVNRTAVESSGGEVDVRFDVVPTFTVRGQIGVAATHAVDSDEPLRNRPHLQGTLVAITRPVQAVEASVAITFVGRNHDSSIPTGDRDVASYARVDAVLSWRFRRNARLMLAIDNLLDRNYEEVIGFPGPRRGARVGFSIDL